MYNPDMTTKRPDMRNLQVSLAEEDYVEVKTYADARSFSIASIIRMITHLWADEQRNEREDMVQDAPKARRK
jgi:hypothetical protein